MMMMNNNNNRQMVNKNQNGCGPVNHFNEQMLANLNQPGAMRPHNQPGMMSPHNQPGMMSPMSVPHQPMRPGMMHPGPMGQLPPLQAIPERSAVLQDLANQVRIAQQEEERKRHHHQQMHPNAVPMAPHSITLPNPQPPRIVGLDSVTTVAYNRSIFAGSDVYTVNQPIVVANNEKRFVRVLWGDGARGHESRWIGFVPSGWKMEHKLAQDPQVLGFFLKPKLCDRSAKTNKRACTGWVTLTIDCERRAIKATIDGWTLGKMFIPTWLMGRVMHPVAVTEPGTPVRFDVSSTRDCEKVMRAGFDRWSLLENTPLDTYRCGQLFRNFEQEVIGMSMEVKFDEDTGDVLEIGDSSEMDYISYTATDMGMGKEKDEVIPLVVNDQHAFRAQERKLWDLFYANDRRPLDYLSERMAAVVAAVYAAKKRRRRRECECAVTKLAHLRHVLFFLASRDLSMVKDANDRVRWFLMNTRTAGAHKEHTPDLGRLLICLAVSDFEWEDIAVPFVAEALQRGIPGAMEVGARRGLVWTGPNACSLDDMFEALMLAEHSLPETLLQVSILNNVLKPVESFRRAGVTDDFAMLERVSAEELCCAIGSLSPELRSLVYEFGTRKDEVKKAVLRREGEGSSCFTPAQWALVEAALSDPMRLRGMLFRARMLARCHGSCGMATPGMHSAVDVAHELGTTAESFIEVLAGCGLQIGDRSEYAVQGLIKSAVAACRQKGYVTDAQVPLAQLPAFQGYASARQVLRLGAAGSDKMRRQSRPEPVFAPEVLPNFCETPSVSVNSNGSAAPVVLAPEATLPTANVFVTVVPGEQTDAGLCSPSGEISGPAGMLTVQTPTGASSVSSPSSAAGQSTARTFAVNSPTSATTTSPRETVPCAFGRTPSATNLAGEASPRATTDPAAAYAYKRPAMNPIQVNATTAPATLQHTPVAPAQVQQIVPVYVDQNGIVTPTPGYAPTTPSYANHQMATPGGFVQTPSGGFVQTPGYMQQMVTPGYGPAAPVTPMAAASPMTPGAGAFARSFELASPATPRTPTGQWYETAQTNQPTLAYLTSEGVQYSSSVPQMVQTPSGYTGQTPGAISPSAVPCYQQASGAFAPAQQPFGQPQMYFNVLPTMQN